MFEIKEKPDIVERALLIGICFTLAEVPAAQALLNELEELVNTLGIQVVGKELIRTRETFAKYLCGVGKAEEMKEKAHELKADCVVFDNMLAPSQQREWERLIDVTVVDREEIILDIFAKRAQSKEARLQVELARMNYSLPRMAKMWSHLDRQGGGSGGGKGGASASRGEGEKQIEVDRRLARNRIAQLEKDLELVRRQRATQRKERERQDLASAAIVGYTNAGKSSLLNLLSEDSIMAKDMLFATLDTTTRKIELPSGQSLLITDTVGFIRNLPHRLIEAFKSTLEEAVLANFLIQVVDASDPEALCFYQTTLNVLKELGAENKKMIVILNKIDLLPKETKEETLSTLEKAIDMPTLRMSIQNGVGVESLLEACDHVLSENRKTATFRIPQSEAYWLSIIHSDGKVLSTEYEGNDIILKATISTVLYQKLISKVIS